MLPPTREIASVSSIDMCLDPKSLCSEVERACGQTISSAQGRLRFGDALVGAFLAAKDRFPDFGVNAHEFARFVGERLGDGELGVESLNGRATNDLYLACACLKGSEPAIREFDSRVVSRLPAQLANLQLSSAAMQELLQRLRAKLLVGHDGTGKLQRYSGTGSLRAWTKVLALRDALRLPRPDKQEVTLGEELAAALPSQELGPDVAYQRRLYSRQFKEAFEAAVDELSPRERTLLRQSLVYGNNVDQIAKLYQVHRATAARWVQKARERLTYGTRRILRAKLQLSASQFQSVVRLVDSHLDLSIERLLVTEDESS